MDIYYQKEGDQQPDYIAPEAELAPVLKFGDWLLMLIISLIPIVNVIVLFIWALDSTGNPNRRGFARAMLLLIGVYCALMVFYFGYIAGIFYQIGNMFENI